MAAIPQTLIPEYHAGNEHAAHPELSFLKKYIFSTDHKIIGIQFLLVGLTFLLFGGILALVIRWQLAWPSHRHVTGAFHPLPFVAKWLGWSDGEMPADYYNTVFTMHATLMIFFAIIPLLVGVFGNYLIPLQIGAEDMALPFMNGLAFWLSLIPGAIMMTGFFLPGGPPQAGWTSYPPLSFLIAGGSGALTAAPNFVAPHGVFEQVVSFLRIGSASRGWQGNWPATPLIMTFVTAFCSFAYICTYYVRLGSKPVNLLVSIALSGTAGCLIVKGIQFVAIDGQSCWFLSLTLLGFASLLGAVNYLTTVVKLRCPGMTMFRMPLSVWSLFITSILVLLATPVLASALVLNLLDHLRLTSFFIPSGWTFGGKIVTSPNGWSAGGGFPLLHQHLFWFYSHPAVYIMILPAMGMMSDIIAVFSRKPVFGYRPMIYALTAIAFLGFVVWAHHMFQAGLNPTLGTTFAVSTMFIAIPSAVKVFNWLGTIWGGNIRFTAAMLFALGFVSMFTIGGLSGIFMASTPVDVHIHDTYFIIAHIHYVLFGGSIMGVFASIYFWYPKMFGRMMNERLGQIHFWITFATMNMVFFPMHILGLNGMARRLHDYANYDSFAHFLPMNQFMTYSALALGAAQILIIINFFGSWIWGRKAPSNPWNATTLEWNDTTSPPPHGNFKTVPVVHHGPYEYSSPLSDDDWLPQTRSVQIAGRPAPAHH